MENLILAVRSGLSNYATFAGRASRPAYWWWALALFLIFFVANLLDGYLVAPLLGFEIGDETAGQPLAVVTGLGLFLPNIAVGVRRLHDTGRSGWWLLLGLIPLIGVLVLIYFFVQPGEEGENTFGPRPTWPPAG